MYKMIFFVCAILLFGNAFSYDIQDMKDLWKMKNSLFSSFTDFDELGKNVSQAELKISFLNNFSNAFYRHTSIVLNNVNMRLNGKNNNKCLIIYENFVNLGNSSLEQAKECNEIVFGKFNFKISKLEKAKESYKFFVDNLNITINNVEETINSNEAFILGVEGSYQERRKAFLDVSDYILNSYLNESKKYEVVYSNSRSIIEIVERMIPDLNKCKEVLNEQGEKIFTPDVQKCANTDLNDEDD
ncbi:uncharacterized protein LOC127286234 [Leptopilina boulardi]|uniref:uncharacterized protein LOC127286234 n=1 Tax=Leptopilina boulardi TaxID=63433 RepID=UPI0021F66639|nr:uncharacterized protein LOC127286234 [Leptopilina boulardi]